MIIAGVDTETTGLRWGDHRFVELYNGLYDLSTRKLTARFKTFINPERSIPADATRIHRITAADVAGAPTWREVAAKWRASIERADLIVWHNGEGFDRPFINYELERVGLPPITKPGFDTMLYGRGTTPMGTIPSLGAFCWAMNVPYDAEKAHAAEYDVDVMMRGFFNGLDWGVFDPEHLKPLEIAA